MATSSRHVHIEIEAIITSESNNSQPCNILINIEGKHESANENQHDQDIKITNSGSQQALTSDLSQENIQTDTSSHMSAVIEDLFPFPDEDLKITDTKSTQDSSPDNKKNSEQHSSSSSKDKLSGGGHKPITAKQKTLIQKMADEQNKNCAEVVNSMFNKSIDDLEGQEADTVIKSMRKNRR